MKLCVIGTSHIASIRSAWNEVAPEFPDLNLTFYGSPGLYIRWLRVRAKRLKPENEELAAYLAHTSGGSSEIDPAEYDAFLLYGLALVVPRLRRGISRAVVEALLSASMDRGLCAATARKIRRLSGKPIWVAPNPLEVAPQDAHYRATFHDYHQLLEGLARAFPEEGTHFLPQPAQTIGPDLRVATCWGTGSERLVRPDETDRTPLHADGEVKHMNADYGALWLRDSLPRILGYRGP